MPANVNKVLKTKFNPNLGELFSFELCACACVCVCVYVCVCGWVGVGVCVVGVCVWVEGGSKTTPCLKLVRIMLKT